MKNLMRHLLLHYKCTKIMSFLVPLLVACFLCCEMMFEILNLGMHIKKSVPLKIERTSKILFFCDFVMMHDWYNLKLFEMSSFCFNEHFSVKKWCKFKGNDFCIIDKERTRVLKVNVILSF